MVTDVGLGMKSFLGFGDEVTFAVPVARTHFLEINSETIVKTSDLIESGALYRPGVLNTRVVQGQVNVNGGFEFDAQYEGWEKLLKHAFGSVVTSTPDVTAAPSVRRHLFTVADVVPTGLTMELFRDSSQFASEANKSFIYKGCKITTLGLRAAVGELLRVNCEILGSDAERSAKSSESFSSSRLAVYHQGAVSWNASAAQVSAFNVNIANNLELRPKLGSRVSREPVRGGKIMVTGSLTMEFDSWAMFDDFVDARERVFNCRFTGGLIGATQYPYFIDINMAVSIVTGVRVNLNSPGRVVLELDFKGYRTTTVGEIEITVQNAITSV